VAWPDAVWIGAVVEDLEPLLLDENEPPSSDTERSPPSDEMAVAYDISLEDGEVTADSMEPLAGGELSEETKSFYAALDRYAEVG
jgi:hypothetical protein